MRVSIMEIGVQDFEKLNSLWVQDLGLGLGSKVGIWHVEGPGFAKKGYIECILGIGYIGYLVFGIGC